MKTKERSVWSWVFAFAALHRWMYAGSVLAAALGVACGLAPYFLIADVIRKLLAGSRSLAAYRPDLLWMCAAWAGRVALHSVSTCLSHKDTFHVLGRLRKAACDKLARMPLSAVLDQPSGSLKNILVERIDSIETTLAHILPEFTANLLAPLCILVYLFALDWRMALASLGTFPLGMACFCLMKVGYDERFANTVAKTKALNDTAVEYINGIEVIKVFGKAQSSYERFVTAAREAADSYISWMRQCNLPFAFAMVLMPSTMLTVLPIGGLLVRGGSLAAADFILIILLTVALITPIITCMSYQDDIAKLRTILGEVTAILTAPEQQRPAVSRQKPADSAVRLEDVHFAYHEKEVLHGVSLEIPAGSVCALVGPSGSGKSTIAKLIAALWDVEQGRITIGGADIRALSAQDYSGLVAYVSQDNFLFNESVRENIRMGRPGATDEEVEAAARASGCHEFILGLENGYDTLVGDAGGHLSGGERQRIAIARAMLKDAPIVILDEATAYTDPENEAIIQASVARLVRGKTLLVIAHRLSTIAGADRIFVIRDGRVAAQDTHGELLAQCGLYREMWQAHIAAKDTLKGDAAHV